jgi:hypothetical protein
MASILDKYTLNQETFEGAIAVGRTPSQMLAMFNVTSREMDEFCEKTYGRGDFKLIYEWVRQCTVDEYLQCVKELGLRGNPSALGIIDRAIQKDEAQSTVKIEFVADMPEAGDDDKEDDS